MECRARPPQFSARRASSLMPNEHGARGAVVVERCSQNDYYSKGGNCVVPRAGGRCAPRIYRVLPRHATPRFPCAQLAGCNHRSPPARALSSLCAGAPPPSARLRRALAAIAQAAAQASIQIRIEANARRLWDAKVARGVPAGEARGRFISAPGRPRRSVAREALSVGARQRWRSGRRHHVHFRCCLSCGHTRAGCCCVSAKSPNTRTCGTQNRWQFPTGSGKTNKKNFLQKSTFFEFGHFCLRAR